MRPRFLVYLLLLLVAVVAFPYTASAAAPNIGRISATSYLDLMGSETFPLCGQFTFVETSVSYSGVGPSLGGNGSGALELSVSGPIMTFVGEVSIDGTPAYVEGLAVMTCASEGYTILFGDVLVNVDDDDLLCGSLAGSLSDGVHRNQGRLSLTMSGFTACNP